VEIGAGRGRGRILRPSGDFSALGRSSASRGIEFSPRHEQIGERAGDEQAMGVFLEPAIARSGGSREASKPFGNLLTSLMNAAFFINGYFTH